MIISKIFILLIIACVRRSNSLTQSFHCTEIRYLPLHLCLILVLVEFWRIKLGTSWEKVREKVRKKLGKGWKKLGKDGHDHASEYIRKDDHYDGWLYSQWYHGDVLVFRDATFCRWRSPDWTPPLAQGWGGKCQLGWRVLIKEYLGFDFVLT